MSASAEPTSITLARPGSGAPASVPSRSAQATRKSSRRRSARTALAACIGSACRAAAAVNPAHSDIARPRSQLAIVGQQPQRLRIAGEQVGDVPGPAEQRGEPQRDRALVAQQAQVPRTSRRARRRPDGRPAGRGRVRVRRRTRTAAPAAAFAGSPPYGETPPVSARMCRSAPAGSREYQAPRVGLIAASVVSVRSWLGTRATASSSGR